MQQGQNFKAPTVPSKIYLDLFVIECSTYLAIFTSVPAHLCRFDDGTCGGTSRPNPIIFLCPCKCNVIYAIIQSMSLHTIVPFDA